VIHYITTNGIGNAWVAAELQVMEHKGIPFVLHSMRAPHQNFFGSEWASRLNARTRLLYPLPPASFAWSLLAAPFLFRGRFLAACLNALFGKRESFRARAASIAHVLVACHWARALRRDKPALIHAQWVHSSGTIAMYGAWLLGVPFSFTGHAVDLFRDAAALEDKVKRADFIVCISTFHRDLYRRLGAEDTKLHLVYCGIDLAHYAYHPRAWTGRPPLILSLGRLVEKKGFGVLLDACGMLKSRGVPFRCVIAGDGPLDRPLRDHAARLALQSDVEITGKALLQEELPAFLDGGDIFAQPCVWSKDGDADGTPRTLMEAMASGMPAVSTRVAGIPDMIDDGRTGILVDPEDPLHLADALERLIRDPGLASRLAEGGRRYMEQKFEIHRCLEPLAALFRSRLGVPAPSDAVARAVVPGGIR
jgi:colanic acid/amylovoran biosynthesis glycosyltransferase